VWLRFMNHPELDMLAARVPGLPESVPVVILTTPRP
jgi:hypothetical protein